MFRKRTHDILNKLKGTENEEVRLKAVKEELRINQILK